MHKCPNCGQEFEGKFCPECGAKWQEEKTCPKCGAKISGSSRFCNECGYSFTGTANADTTPKEKQPSKIKQKLSTIGAWIKAHLKIVVPVAVGLVVVIILLSLIPTFIAMKTNGTYYKYRGGKFDEETYFTLSGGKWTDEDGETGTYKIDGENIIFFVEFFGSTEELASGTISNGVLSLDTGGASKDIYVRKDHKHTYGEWKTVREADCTTDGLKTRTCACGDTERDETPRWGHSGEWTILQEATCTEEGSKTRNCAVCGQEENDIVELIPHTYGEWTVSKKATCTEEGTNTRTCVVCDKEETQPIKKLPHSYSIDYKFDEDNHWKECKVCSDKIEFNEHDNKDNCSICGYPFTFSLNSNKQSYKLTGLDSSYIKTEITIPSMFNKLPVTSIDKSAFKGCSSLTSITVDENNPNYSSQDGILYNKAKTEFVHIPKALNGDITIPNSITSIGYEAFYGCASLKGITIPESVTSIGSYAFCSCSSLASINIPNSVTSIGAQYTFCGCSSLTSITIPDNVTSINHFVFADCTSLTSIVIPDSVKSIYDFALRYCTSLTNITFKGTVDDWKKIEKFIGWDGNTGDYTIYCTDGEIAKDGTVTMY